MARQDETEIKSEAGLGWAVEGARGAVRDAFLIRSDQI